MQSLSVNWPVAKKVHAYSTIRHQGYSGTPFDSFNLADHVGDNIDKVQLNRLALVEKFNLPQMPAFLNQTHRTDVLEIPVSSNLHTDDKKIISNKHCADAVYTREAQQVCLVMTADCLPILICNNQGNEVAAIHAGWRGLCNGIIENTIKKFNSTKHNLLAWLGPAIGPTAFQIGEEVVAQFIAKDEQAKYAFKQDPNSSNKYLGNLYLLATQRLILAGVSSIHGGNHCTYTEKELFFSYRRDHITGRMASMIWFE